VTRIIAGTARGRRLRVPASGTRPTADRVREAMFASLDHLLGGLSGLHVLDLYAGSGALGLEAVSRGAARAVLVESDRRTAAIARQNAQVVAAGRVEVVTARVGAYLAASPVPFDLVLADPPYAVTDAQVDELVARLAAGWLAPGGVVVVERARAGPGPSWPTGLRLVREATYGGTSLWYGQRASEGEDR
jgi:16S rRNA (guanine966-N2)-methyltransferase